MRKREFIKRFLDLECKGNNGKANTIDDLLLSYCRTMGIPLKFNEAFYTSFGRFKLRDVHQKVKVYFLHNLYFDAELLYRAMRILHRRKKFGLGLYLLGTRYVFAVREGSSVILLAPMECDYDENFLNLEEFVVRVNKSRMERWKIWTRILNGTKV